MQYTNDALYYGLENNIEPKMKELKILLNNLKLKFILVKDKYPDCTIPK